MESWKIRHPRWEQKVWREEDLFSLSLTGELCKRFESNPVFVCDIARTEIVFQSGGIYADVDIELLRPINYMRYAPQILGCRLDLGSGAEDAPTTCFFGFPAGSPFLKAAIESFIQFVESIPDGQAYHPETNGIDGRWEGVWRLNPIPFNFHHCFRFSRTIGHRSYMIDKTRAELFGIHHLKNTWRGSKIEADPLEAKG
jgi:hypothetical protein